MRRNGQKKEKGERARDGELLIRNRLEHTHTHTYWSDIIGQECCAEEPTTERDGRGGGLAFSFWQGKRRGNMERGVRGYGRGLRLGNATSAFNTKVRCRQVQLPAASVRVGFN